MYEILSNIENIRSLIACILWFWNKKLKCFSEHFHHVGCLLICEITVILKNQREIIHPLNVKGLHPQCELHLK